ncbi:MAG TPA: urate hydroxylase PuuD [Verrucomicrobiae bacterium]|jgi:uncharacterized membrane protein|nr:urate hydroxylase PuuD [Verrucomicrobiae bacterium]
MDLHLNEWLQLAFRWAHVFAGIMWVGATYYFTWLDGRFVELEEKVAKGENPEKYVWMVHSGGFYLVEKQKRPTMMGQTLHWFRWEAAFTWLTGVVLFVMLYYHGGLMEEFEDPKLSNLAAIILSVGMILGGWVIYDLVWKFCKQETVGIVISYLLIVATAWVSCHYFAARAAYLQLGAMMGTIMAANVWMVILPAQKRMVAALKDGREPDYNEGARAKGRSKHNSFIVIPVVFIMISNHYPFTYGSSYNWIILSALVLVGWGAAKMIRRA